MADWRSDEYYARLRATKVEVEDFEYFAAQPLTTKWLRDPEYSPIITACRIPLRDEEDTFMGKTLKTNDTVKNWLAIVSDRSFPKPGALSRNTNVTNQEPGPDHPEVLICFNLQSGLNGFQRTAHGGLLSCLMDETLATVVELHRAISSSGREELYTARLTVTFRRTVRTPGVFLSKAWLEKKEGRKRTVKGVLEDSDGQVCVEADGVWIAARAPSHSQL